jgi:hypothetical protein
MRDSFSISSRTMYGENFLGLDVGATGGFVQQHAQLFGALDSRGCEAGGKG